MFFIKKTFKLSEFYFLEPILYPKFTDIVKAMNSLIQEIHNHNESCITVSRRTQEFEVHLANE